MKAERWTIATGPDRGIAGWVIVDGDGDRIDAASSAPYHPTREAAWAAVGGRPVVRGRPPLANPRSEILRVRLTAAELAEVRRLAARSRMSAPDYVRSLVLA